MPVEIIMPGSIWIWHRVPSRHGMLKRGRQFKRANRYLKSKQTKPPWKSKAQPGCGAFYLAHSGDTIEIGKTIGWLFEAGETIKNPSLHANETGQNTARTTETLKSADADTKSDPQDETHGLTDVTLAENKVRATPLARRLAKTKNIDITKVAGSGPAAASRGRMWKITPTPLKYHRRTCGNANVAPPIHGRADGIKNPA